MSDFGDLGHLMHTYAVLCIIMQVYVIICAIVQFCADICRIMLKNVGLCRFVQVYASFYMNFGHGLPTELLIHKWLRCCLPTECCQSSIKTQQSCDDL
jgi:hypothetical protein